MGLGHHKSVAILTYRYRVKSLNGLLNRQARAVNFVWNYLNERQKDAIRFRRRWHTHFDLVKLTTGSSKELGLHSCTVGAVCKQYVISRAMRKRPFLRWRGQKSLGWVPLAGSQIREIPGGFRFHSRDFKVFKSRDLPPGAKINDGTSFSQDSRGNWFLNICFEVADVPVREPVRGVGIDLGIKEFAVLSSGERIAAQHFYRDAQPALAVAQRAHKTRRFRALHAQVTNRRNDFQYKLVHRLVRDFDYIVVGNIHAARMGKTMFAKSVYDAGWSSFKRRLAQAAIRHGAWFEEVSERFTTQTCHECESIAGPRGQTGLRKRDWICSGCGTAHDRDLNSARNILLRGSGRRSPAEGISVLRDGGDVKELVFAEA